MATTQGDILPEQGNGKEQVDMSCKISVEIYILKSYNNKQRENIANNANTHKCILLSQQL